VGATQGRWDTKALCRYWHYINEANGKVRAFTLINFQCLNASDALAGH